jgi:hypothetical protein
VGPLIVDPSRSTARRLRPILLGLITAVPAFLILYLAVIVILFALAPH